MAHSTSVDTTGKEQPRTLRIRLRSDVGAGVALGGDDVLAPGETRAVPYHIARRLLASQKAVVAPDPAVVETAAPVVAHRDPEPARKGKK